MDDLKNRVLRLAEKYLDYPEDAVYAAIISAARVEYATHGLGYLEGYYCPSRVEVFVSGCKRGRLIKKIKPAFDGYKYYFSADNEIILIDTFNGIGLSRRELMVSEEDYLYGIYYYAGETSFQLDHITVTHYSNSLVRSYTDSVILPLDTGLKMDMNNLHVYLNYQEYIYSDKPDTAIIKVGLKHAEYRTDTNLTKIYAQEELDLKGHSESDKTIKMDDQRALAKKLKSKINKEISLEQAIENFFSVISESEPNEEALLLYEAGSCSADIKTKICRFSLVRQTPSADGEYYQLYLDLQYEMCDELKTLKESHWHDYGDIDLKDYILKSEAYNMLKDRKIIRIKVGVDKT
ncbi:MAG: hypothetical protein IKE95_06385 [Methanobrevibacter sp.]|nr:hypothetical protein [Methanobrevibacter sp.]